MPNSPIYVEPEHNLDFILLYVIILFVELVKFHVQNLHSSHFGTMAQR